VEDDTQYYKQEIGEDINPEELRNTKDERPKKRFNPFSHKQKEKREPSKDREGRKDNPKSNGKAPFAFNKRKSSSDSNLKSKRPKIKR